MSSASRVFGRRLFVRGHGEESRSSPPRRRHLRLRHGDDAFVFVVATGLLGGSAAVSVVLVRASSAAHPRLACTFCAKPALSPSAADLEGAVDASFG